MADDRRIQIPVNLISCDDIYHSAKGTTWKKHKYIKKEGGRYFYPKEGGGSNTALTLASKEAKALLEKGKDFIDFQLNDPGSWLYGKMTNLIAAFENFKINGSTDPRVRWDWATARANPPGLQTPKEKYDESIERSKETYDYWSPWYGRPTYDESDEKTKKKLDEWFKDDYKKKKTEFAQRDYPATTSKAGERLIKQAIVNYYDIPEKPKGYKNRAEKVNEMYEQIVYAEAVQAGEEYLKDYKEKKKSKK